MLHDTPWKRWRICFTTLPILVGYMRIVKIQKKVAFENTHRENSRHLPGPRYWHCQIDGTAPHGLRLQDWQCFNSRLFTFRGHSTDPITRTSQDIGQNWKTQTGYFSFGPEKSDKTVHRTIVSTLDYTGYNCPRSDFSILVHRCK